MANGERLETILSCRVSSRASTSWSLVLFPLLILLFTQRYFMIMIPLSFILSMPRMAFGFRH